ncbi:MAG: hypothetical protein KDA78_20010 [Planctomycetaceae bacterium]|nr:hypothetical protein [Planctomycetaceae bacterium]
MWNVLVRERISRNTQRLQVLGRCQKCDTLARQAMAVQVEMVKARQFCQTFQTVSCHTALSTG